MSDHPKRVVLVEDNDDDADLVARGARRFQGQLDLIRFRTIPGALEHLVQEHEAGSDPQLVLVDGKVGGSDAGDYFQGAERAGLGHVPGVVLTGSSDQQTAARFLGAGARRVLTKPTEYAEFQQVISEILEEFCDVSAHDA